jgi:hypothetical protein
MLRRVALLVGALVAVAGGLTACDPNAEYDVAFFGDVPYSTADFARYDNDQEASDRGRIAYQSMFEAVTNQTAFFAGEVLFIHGDGHSFKNDKPIAGRANLRRVQVEGDSKVSYVRVHVDPSAGADIFTVTKSQAF